MRNQYISWKEATTHALGQTENAYRDNRTPTEDEFLGLFEKFYNETTE
jgi:hypothetical protein